MKTLITLATILLLASCSKEKLDSVEPQSAYATGVTWTQAYAGGTPSIKFSVNLVITAPVTKVNLIRANTLQAVYEVKNPQTGNYTMYFHGAMVPTHPQHEMYFFEFMMADGSKILTEPFQVY